MICFIQFCSKDTQVSGNAPNLARVKRCFFPGTYRAFLGFQPFKPAPSTQLKQAWMHDSPPPPKAPESRPLVSPWTVPTPWKFRLTSGGMVQGCSLNRSRAVLTSSSCCSRPHAQSASGPDKGPPPSAAPVAPTDVRRGSGKPGLERRAQPRGPQSRVRGGERGRPPRPSWEAPGARSRSPRRPAPATSTTAARLLGTKAAGSHAHKAAGLPLRPLRVRVPPPAPRPASRPASLSFSRPL